jgi:3-hydroxyisobutyrate dehydrogenase
MKVAFIGLGNMGKPMAVNIAKGGNEVFVFDSNTSLAATVAKDIGVKHLERLSDIAVAEIIVTMLPDGHVVREVALGDNGIASAAKPGTLLIDMSSSQPLITRGTGARLLAKHIVLIDAPVSGGSQRAAAGTLAIMIGSDSPDAVARAKPVLSCMGTSFFEVGKLGSGHAVKALNNVVAASNYAVLAEALNVGERYGIKPETIVDIINVSTGQSFCSTVVMKQFVVPQTFNTGFQIGLLAKDAKIAAELSEDLECNVPFIEQTDKLWAEARDEIGPTADMSKAILAWQQLDAKGVRR